MPQSRSPSLPGPISIAAAEQETGLSKDVLRAWERRYGFPAPLRDRNGDRCYPPEQIRRLRLLRQLVDLGDRPGKLSALDDEQLAARLACHVGAQDTPSADKSSGALDDCMGFVAASAAHALEERLNSELIRLGLERFAKDLAAPLCAATGLAWERGDIGVHHEHLFSQVLARCLRQAIERVGALRGAAAGRSPAIILTTAPGEIHELGLLMVEAVLVAHDVPCLNLGPQMPVGDLVMAAKQHGCRAVGLSFSSWFDARRATAVLGELRRKLPEACQMWVGGANSALRRQLPDGITVFTNLDDIAPALSRL